MEKIKDIIAKYYGTLRLGLEKGKLDFEALPFGNEISIVGPNEQFVGKKSVMQMYPEFLNILRDFHVKESFFSEASACVIVEFFPHNGADSVLTAEWFKIKDGLITQIHPIYDTQAWVKALT